MKAVGVLSRRGKKEKWRPQCQAVKYSLLSFEIQEKSLSDNVLRFNPIQIAACLAHLLDSGMTQSQRGLEVVLGVDQTRIGQFLRLMRLPLATRTKLRDMPDLNEFQTRRLVGKRAVLAAGEE